MIEQTRQARMLECAIAYADLGLPVLPLWSVDAYGHCLCGKKDCPSPGKHPHGKHAHHGLKDATTDGGAIAKWFSNGPINIGIRTGTESRLVVLDVDPDHGGNESLKKLGVLPNTPRVQTGSGGQHYFFKHPGGNIRNSAGTLGPGLDIRADGGYVVAPPSLHTSGNEYKWLVDARVPLADMPRCLLQTSTGKKAKTTAHRERSQTIKEGERDNTLASLAGTMRHRGMGFEAIYAALREENQAHCVPPLSDADVERIARSISSYEPAHKRFNLTDAGNGERFAAQHGDKVRYCWSWGKWLYYDGKRWNIEIGAEKANHLAVRTARSIAREADDLAHDERGNYLKWSHQSESTTRLTGMLQAARAVRPIAAYGSQFDTNTWLLNCLNGTVDLKTGELRPHNPNDMITKLAPTQHDPQARLKMWDDFLGTATGDDASLREFLQVAIGYGTTGSTAEEKLFFIHGPTASGKSTFLEAVKATLGDYAQTANFESFLQRQQIGGVRNDIAKLNGARMVISIELEEGKRLAEGLVKMLTGGDTVSARFLYKEEFEFVPQFKLWLAANDAPKVNDNDEALWRRILRVPFENEIPKEDRDPKVKAILRDTKAAGPAILAWIVEGCLKWQQKGLVVPESIEGSTEEYRQSQDPLRDFFDDECEFDSEAYVPVTELRAAYEQWAKDNGARYTLGPREFNKRLESKNCERLPKRIPNEFGTEKPTKCWRGVTLKSNPTREDLEEIQNEIPF
jgi:putative DNA primase/helicase